MVKNQIVNLTFDHSFDHNLSFKFPIGKCEHTFDICVLKKIQWFKKTQFEQVLLFTLLAQLFKTLWDTNPQSMKAFENVGIHFFAFSHACECALESWYILLICFPFHSLTLVVEFKVRVTTIKVYMFLLGGIIEFSHVVATTYYISCWLP
jgi:hypothetical protein